jgi:Cys-rich repeat protein
MSPLSQCLTNVDPTLNACVECTAMLQCSGVRPICDLATTHRCTACLANGDCAGATPKCLKDAMDVTKNACVGCLVNADCMAPNPTCDTTNTHKCVPCLADMDCGAGKFCVTNANPLLNVCVSCRNDTDCGAATPACDTTTKTCVPCRVNGATLPHLGCMNPNAACKANVDPSMNMCVECTQDSHCNGGKTCMMNACG